MYVPWGCMMGEKKGKETQTSMHDAIPMTIIQRTPNLPRKLPRHPFPQPPMADNIIQHLAAVDILKHHVVMVLMYDHLAHAADVWMVQEHGECGLAQSADLLGGVFGGLFGDCIGGV